MKLEQGEWYVCLGKCSCCYGCLFKFKSNYLNGIKYKYMYDINRKTEEVIHKHGEDDSITACNKSQRNIKEADKKKVMGLMV